MDSVNVTMPCAFQTMPLKPFPKQTKHLDIFRFLSPQTRIAFTTRRCFRLATAQQIRNELKTKVDALYKLYAMRPGLAVVLEVGLESFNHDLPESVTEARLLQVIDELNQDPRVHGILVQLPLPAHISTEKVLQRIDVSKDVDGFHAENVGRLCTLKGEPGFIPCTPQGCLELLDRYNIQIQGKHAVVLGRSNIVGIPAAMLLLRRNATVSICHSFTENLSEEVSKADILIAAIGKPEWISGHWLKPNSVVIDVGINAVKDVNTSRGYRLVGDVRWEEAYPRNTVKAFEQRTRGESLSK
ncbi:Bifunctional protein FolD 4, chloroplastic [Galdieria sulphuraria]|nr:Bifunctional protein FolD 4, chloroplastic [Galdieria sulphuraria]